MLSYLIIQNYNLDVYVFNVFYTFLKNALNTYFSCQFYVLEYFFPKPKNWVCMDRG